MNSTQCSLAEMKAANEAAGGHFFGEANMKSDSQRGAVYYTQDNLLTVTYHHGHVSQWLFEPRTGRLRPWVDGEVEKSL